MDGLSERLWSGVWAVLEPGERRDRHGHGIPWRRHDADPSLQRNRDLADQISRDQTIGQGETASESPAAAHSPRAALAAGASARHKSGLMARVATNALFSLGPGRVVLVRRIGSGVYRLCD